MLTFLQPPNFDAPIAGIMAIKYQWYFPRVASNEQFKRSDRLYCTVMNLVMYWR